MAEGYRSATLLRAPILAGAVGASALAAALLPPAGAAATAAAATTAALMAVGPRSSTARPGDHALRRHLAICRRREEPALVLVASIRGRRGTMTNDLRVSDTAVIETRRRGSLLVAIVDGQDPSRERIVQRLREKHGDGLAVGWAMFPDEGLTLDGLVELASARACVPAAHAAQLPLPRPVDDLR